MDGSGNNIVHPTWGAANSPYRRAPPPNYADTSSTPNGVGLPAPRTISNNLISRGDSHTNYDLSGASEFMPAWGVLLHLDITLACRNSSDPLPIPVPTGDPQFDPFSVGNMTMPFSRTCRSYTDPVTGERTMPNTFSSYIDGSGLYSNDPSISTALRSFVGGKLNSVVDPVAGELPLYNSGTNHFLWGSDIINILPQLNILYILLLREHNRQATLLAAANPTWTDAQLFNRARRWVIALIQRFTLYVYVPQLTGLQVPYYAGYNSSVDAGTELFFANVAFRYGHSAVNSALFRVDDYGEPTVQGHMLVRDFIFNPVEIRSYGIDALLRGLTIQRKQEVDIKFVDDIRCFMNLNAPYGFDLASVGIQRARELGLPYYNAARATYGLSSITSWSQLTNDTTLLASLASLYPAGPATADAYVGAFLEPHVGSSLVGPLMTASIREQFLRYRDGDRWWYENPGVLTDEELSAVQNMTLGKLIKLNTNITWFPDNPFVALTLPVVFSASAATTETNVVTSKSLRISDTYLVSWTLDSTASTVTFSMETNNTGWVGLGFGADMVGADMYIVTPYWNSTWNVYDCYASTNNRPSRDIDVGGTNSIYNVIDLVSTSATTSLHGFSFTRQLQTSDSYYDTVITNANLSMIFAWSDDPAFNYHGANNRLHASVNLYSAVNPGVTSANLASLKYMHGVVMFCSFAFIYPLGIFVARYSQDLGRWLDIHRALMMTVTSNVLVVALTALVGSYGDMGFTHSKVGSTEIALIATISITGYLCSTWAVGWAVTYSHQIRLIHRYGGYLAYVMGLANGYLGICDLTSGAPSSLYLPKLYLVAVTITPLSLVVYGEWKNRRASKDRRKGRHSTAIAGQDSLPRFSWLDVNDRVANGAKWIVIDDVICKCFKHNLITSSSPTFASFLQRHPDEFVVTKPTLTILQRFLDDAAGYLDRHPGGARFILNVVGMDATKYFHGDYFSDAKTVGSKSRAKGPRHLSLTRSGRTDDDGMGYHYHSRLARFTLSSLAVGRLTVADDINRSEDMLVGSTIDLLGPSQNDSGKDAKSHLQHSSMNLFRQAPLRPDRFKPFTISSRITSTSEGSVKPVRKITMEFGSTSDVVKCHPGDSILLQFVDKDGRPVTREYTPIKVENRASISFYIKMYDGQMTSYLGNPQNTSIRMRGPVPNRATLMNPRNANGCWDVLGLIAGGSGLSRMLLILDHHLKNGARDKETNRLTTRIHLLNINHSDKDIFAHEELEYYESEFQGALTITNLVYNAPPDFVGLSGHVDAEIIAETMPRIPESKQGKTASSVHTTINRSGWRNESRTTGINVDSGTLRQRLQKKSLTGSGPRNSSSVEILKSSSMGADESLRRSSSDVAADSEGLMLTVTEEEQSNLDLGPISRPALKQAVELPSESNDTIIVVCGPTVMNIQVLDLLSSAGYPRGCIVSL
ncbi:hypothetical protein SmJEL517_g00706 [Synchytrium microbalum]|uniref:Cytochrome b5 heme-binding domain-containing protein n=1 Tax=Synchytrium microbalum TaxID=1806994 RepID=A0A507CIF8_9FUNG|nr:uncharacterized protein SmJEL517_g00706 [Synchytrium microbalum]TPX37485.1 hypothetical protein SmJEL517_g00706 [Synchytrium microbalum]